MTNLFKKNLHFLNKHLPKLAHKFHSYRPKKIKAHPYIKNDVFIEEEAFYSMDGRIACKQQVDFFLSSPTHFSLKYVSDNKSDYLHQKAINQLNAISLELAYKKESKPFLSNLMVLGSGLGFYLDNLIDEMDYQSIILIEPDDDILFYFLHYTDLDLLNTHCNKNGGQLCILQPKTAPEFSNQIKVIAENIGYGVFSELTLFRHYETALFDEIYNNFKSLRHEWLSTWGFFDDEIMGITHSLENSKNHPFILSISKVKAKKYNHPFVVVGNGPSLDNDIKDLKERQDNCIIVSCGTSIGALIRENIQPDIHVEMERSPYLADIQTHWFSDYLREKTVLFALNTVSPDITNCFKNVIVFPKENDVGGKMLLDASSRNFDFLTECNPTVTNFAISALSALKVEQIILLGCDYGFRDQNQHHSTKSDYFDESSPLKRAKFHSDVSILDNHGNTISSIRIFNESRKNVELTIQKHPKTSYINCSDGAKINGANWNSFHKLSKKSTIKENFPMLYFNHIQLGFIEQTSKKKTHTF